MESSVSVRLGLVILACLGSIYVLVPSFLPKPVQEQIELLAKRAEMENPPPLENPPPDWVSYLPNTAINLGLDLQGGLDLTLDVGVEAGVLSSAQRDVPALKDAAEKQGLKLGSVRRAPEAPVLRIEPGEGATVDAVSTLVRETLGRYDYVGTETIDGKTILAYQMTDSAADEVRKRSVEQALETIRNRVDETGVKEPSITLKGDAGINVQLPGETDVDAAIEAVGTTARLVFMLVDEDSILKDGEGSFQPIMPAVDEAKTVLDAKTFANDRALSNWLVANGKLPEDRVLLWQYVRQDGVETRVLPWVLDAQELLTGDDINNASTGTDPQSGQYEVHLDFKPRGSQIFGQVTGANINKRFAIVLDDKVRSAPVIQGQIFNNARITVGGDGPDAGRREAGTLALVLRSGALPAPVTPGDVRVISASLGQLAIEEGVMAAGLSGLLVFVFAAFYYRVSGLLADLSLAINVVLVLACLAVAGATLTLPGICGIALTVGMAVDCNIIFYERIRDELRAGKSPFLAVEAGFERASHAVFDANITTLLAGVVLYSYGSGPLRGFAVTLMIGVFTTLFSGVFVSRTLMNLYVRRNATSMSI